MAAHPGREKCRCALVAVSKRNSAGAEERLQLQSANSIGRGEARWSADGAGHPETRFAIDIDSPSRRDHAKTYSEKAQ